MTVSERLTDFAADVRFAARGLGRSPAMASIMVISLALGFALTSSTLAVVNAYLIRSMPYPAADRLYHVSYAQQGQSEPRGLSAFDWNSLGDVVEFADTSMLARFYLKDGGYTDEAMGLLAAPGSLEGLGLRTVVGRLFGPDDFRGGGDQVAIIGRALWTGRFGSDPAIVGRVFRANTDDQTGAIQAFRIVGVLDREFRDARNYGRGVIDVITPARATSRPYLVRLRAGVRPEVAQRRIDEAVRGVASWFPPDWRGVQLESVHERYVSSIRPLLLAVAAGSGLVLIIICANIAVLMLLRALRRQKEVAIRAALGASRTRLVQLAMAEAVLICGAAIAGGLALTNVALRLLAPAIEEQIGRPVPGGTSAIGIDGRMVLAAAVIGATVAVSLSFVPLLLRAPRRLNDTLRRPGLEGADGPSVRRLRSGLVALEIAGSLALLAGCALMIRTALHLVHTDLGFRTQHIVRARIALPSRTYPDRAAMLSFYDRLRAHPALKDVSFALTNYPPFFQAPPQQVEADVDDQGGLASAVIAVTDTYFSTLDIPITRGRGFTSADRLGSEPVAIVSETFAARVWPGQEAVGRRLRAPELPVRQAPLTAWRTVVGVVRDVRQTYTDGDLKDVYIPFSQAPAAYAPVHLRSDRPSDQWLDTLRTAIGSINPDVLVAGATTLERESDRLIAGTRFLTSALTSFALFAVFLASLGIYGVTAYAVQQREREIAIRMALGATAGGVVRLFVQASGVVVAAGLVMGTAGAAALARTLENQLHGVRPYDAATLAATAAALTAAALAATWWPARRAACTDPVAALKEN